MFKKNKEPASQGTTSPQQQESPRFGPPSTKNRAAQQAQKAAILRTGAEGKSQYEYLRLAQQQPKPSTDRRIAPSQLAMHCEEGDAWTSLNGVVYDVTSYLRYHPGGKAKLLQGCGKECQQLFNKYHPWVNGKYMLAKFRLGVLDYSLDR